jgi:phosphoglycolate phosphatase-like HAD superfamily hydrolase
MNVLEEDKLSENTGIILWDIDGTLISSKRNSNIILHQKALEDCGFGLIAADFETQGVTDWEIISRLLSKIKYIATENELAIILKKLDALSEESNRVSSFVPLPGVSNFLKNFKTKFWIQGILTGNTSNRALAKLKHASIANYFNLDYIFCCESNEKRIDIARRAEKYIDSQRLKSTVIVGDTPYDIAVAKKINAKVISVATGKFSKYDLKTHNPDLLIRNFKFSSKKVYKFLKMAEVTT